MSEFLFEHTPDATMTSPLYLALEDYRTGQFYDFGAGVYRDANATFTAKTTQINYDAQRHGYRVVLDTDKMRQSLHVAKLFTTNITSGALTGFYRAFFVEITPSAGCDLPFVI